MGKHPPLLLAIEAALKEVEEVKVFRQSKRDCMRSLVRLQKAFIARGMVGTEDEFVLLRDAIKGLSVGELQIIAMDVFSRPECVFNYCPHPEYCSTECQSPGDPQ